MPNILDRVEKRTKGRKPLRETIDKTTDNIPSGPLGKGGDGSVVGVAGMVAARTGQLAVLPIPGVKQPGFSVISHGVDERDTFERHTIRINAAVKQVAEVVCEYLVAAPSNVDFVSGEVETVSIEEINERNTYSTWQVIVDVADRGQKEA